MHRFSFIFCTGLLLLLPALLLAEEGAAAAEGYEAGPAALAESARAELQNLSSDLLRETRRLSARQSGAAPLTVDDALRQIGSARTPGDIFRWIRDNIGFEPYAGSLRGAEGTLIAGSANSVDQALLGAALLQAAGHEVRFVVGELHNTDARQVLTDAIGEASLYLPDASYRNFSATDLAAQRAFAQSIRDHVWLEVNVRGQYQAFDPVTAPIFGMTPASAQSRHERLPSQYQTTMQIVLVSHLRDGQVIENITIEGPLPLYAYRSLALSFEEDPTRGRGFRPMLRVGDQQARGESVPVASLVELELRYSVRIGQRENRWQQTLYRRDQGRNIFDFDHQHFSIAVLPGWTASDQIRSLSGAAAADALRALDAWIEKEGEAAQSAAARRVHANAVLDGLGATLSFAFAHQLDQNTKELATHLGIVPVMARPRIVTTGILRQGDEFLIDLQLDGDRVEALPRAGVPAIAAPAFLGMHGQLREQLTGEMISAYSGRDVTNLASIFRQASRESIRFTTIEARTMEHLELLRISDTIRERIRRQIQRRSLFILAPLSSVEQEGLQRFGWWALDPITGALEAHTGEPLFVVAGNPSQYERSEAVDIADLLRGHLALVARHFSASSHAAGDENRFPELTCNAQRQLSRLGSAFCATSAPIPLEDINQCLDNPPQPGGDLLSLGRVKCKDQTASVRCASVFVSAVLSGQLAIAPAGATPQSLPAPLCS